MLTFRVLSRTNLVDRHFWTSSISFTSFRLRTLFRSLRSFSHPHPLFSMTSVLFLQNTRGGGYLHKSPLWNQQLRASFFALSCNCFNWLLLGPENSDIQTFRRAFCSPFVFILLRIPFPASPFFSHPCKTPRGGGPSSFSVHSPPGRQRGDQGFATEESFAA
jgi:hypothetical protein